MSDYLKTTLRCIDWTKSIKEFCDDITAPKDVEAANLRIAIWSRQFENIEGGNPAICFIREMQIAGQHVAALLALSLYKPAAVSMRIVLETALYYTYYRTHPVELATLVRDPTYYTSKSEIIEFHRCHTDDFGTLQNRLNLLERLNRWYSDVSSIVHGQIPGVWHHQRSLGDVAFSKATLDASVIMFCKGEQLVHNLFLCTAGRDLWPTISAKAKGQLLKGVDGAIKTEFGFDAA